MSEPTMDEMLAWLDSLTYDGYNNTPCNNAIRAILELHRLPAFTQGMEDARKQVELTAIRAFVERVKKRAQDDHFKGQDHAYAYLVDAELAALEKETQTQ